MLQRELAAQGGIALALNVMGDDMLNQGDYARARELLEEGLIIYRELGIKEGIARSLYSLGRVTFGQGDYATAQTLHEESLTLYRELGNTFLLALSLEELGAVVAAQERPVWTARLLGVASTLREALGSPPLPFERTNYNRMVAYARTQLGEEVFAKALAEGRTMTPEQALAAREPATMPQQVCTESPLTSLAKASTNLWGLTAREMEVLRLLARGLSNAQIAEELVVSLLTVKAHLRSIYSKLGVTSRSAATRYALEHHLS